MILAIDTSTQWVGIALFDGALVHYEKIWKTSRRHTVELTPAIQSAFHDCEIAPGKLTAVAAAIGPGSFTSLRIGLAVAKGFALSQHIPIIGVPSLDICARGIPVQASELICVLRAGRGRLAAQQYEAIEEKWVGVGDLKVVTADELEERIVSPTVICGEMNADEKKTISRRWRNAIIPDPPLNVRRPSILAQIAHERFNAGEADNSATIAPIYLRTVKNIDR